MSATKICSRSDCHLAGVPQPLGDFYKRKNSSDGRKSECAGCSRKDNYRNRKMGRSGEYDWEYQKAWAKTKKGKMSRKRSMSKWRKRNPEKVKAERMTFSKVMSGAIRSARESKCVECGEQAVHLHHHNGYEEEHLLDVIPVCRICHKKLDSSQDT